LQCCSTLQSSLMTDGHSAGQRQQQRQQSTRTSIVQGNVLTAAAAAAFDLLSGRRSSGMTGAYCSTGGQGQVVAVITAFALETRSLADCPFSRLLRTSICHPPGHH